MPETARELYRAHVADHADPLPWEALTPAEQAGWRYAAAVVCDCCRGRCTCGGRRLTTTTDKDTP